MTTAASLRRSGPTSETAAAWRDRSARLYEELCRPARAMVRRAFRSAFGDDEIEDIYSNAWVGTLRALGRRHGELTDDEIRKYVLTAVANHAAKELRRRKRRPTAPLEAMHIVADDGVPPDERASKLEESRMTRDLLASLPPRRRAVMLLRYGWGLEPQQVCGLIKGLSPRAYRKEITRGIDELTQKMRLLREGEWCADREPVLKAYAAGLADAEEERQAQQHLSHCRHCGEFVGRLTGHLHDVGASVALPGAIDGIHGGHLPISDRIGELVHRVRDSVGNVVGGRSANASSESAVQSIAASGGARGAGAAGTGALAKFAGLGGAGKLVALCLGGGAAATLCVASGVVPVRLAAPDHGGPGTTRPAVERSVRATSTPAAVSIPPELGNEVAHGSDSASGAAEPSPAPPDPDPAPAPAPVSTPAPSPDPAPIAPSTPPQQQEFGVASATPTASSTSSSTSSGSGGGAGSAAQQEFGQP